MSPEYAMQGLYSVKSDVFSFGVLLLEIISGRRSYDYYDDDSSETLIGHVTNSTCVLFQTAFIHISDNLLSVFFSYCFRYGNYGWKEKL